MVTEKFTEERHVSKIKEVFWFGLSTAILVGLIYFAGFEDFMTAFRSANGYILAPAFVTGILTFSIWGFSWYRVFKKVNIEAGYLKSLEMFMAGNFLNSITPLGQAGGEPFMAYIISSNTDTSYEKAFSAVLSSDIINSIPPFTFIIGGAGFLLFFFTLNSFIMQALYLTFTAIIVGGTLVYLLWFKAGSIEGGIIRILRFFTGIIGRGEGLVDRIEERLDNFRKAIGKIGEDPRYLFETVVFIHAGFILEVFTLYLILASLGYDPMLTHLYFVLPLTDMANYSPTPGGSGTYEAAMAGFLTVFLQMNFAAALSAAILYRLATYWPGMLIGYFSFNAVRTGGK